MPTATPLSPAVPTRIAKQIARRTASGTYRDRLWLARNEHIDPQVLAEFVAAGEVAKDQGFTSRYDPEQWLAQDVARTAVRNPRCPSAILDRALAEDLTGMWLCGDALHNPALTATQLRRFLARAQADNRPAYGYVALLAGRALAHPACPVPVLTQWIHHPKVTRYALQGIAAHPKLPLDLQLMLAGHRLSHVRKTVAGREDLTPEAIQLLCQDTRAGVLTALVRAGHADASTISRAAGHTSRWVRGAVAAHAVDPDVVTRMAMDPVPVVRAKATRNAACPEEGHVVAALIG
jgi:hypothetical protein